MRGDQTAVKELELLYMVKINHKNII